MNFLIAFALSSLLIFNASAEVKVIAADLCNNAVLANLIGHGGTLCLSCPLQTDQKLCLFNYDGSIEEKISTDANADLCLMCVTGKYHAAALIDVANSCNELKGLSATSIYRDSNQDNV